MPATHSDVVVEVVKGSRNCRHVLIKVPRGDGLVVICMYRINAGSWETRNQLGETWKRCGEPALEPHVINQLRGA